jgi:predicted DCC family thiol-disulfide oxidoreductase YuxK
VTSRAGEPRAEAAPAGIVLFDGVCAFCDAAVTWLVQRDPEARLRFAPLQGPTAASLRARHPGIPQELSTLVYVEGSGPGERVHLRSDAVFRACAAISGAPRWIGLAGRLPRSATDLGYRIFARLRYRVFGRLDACRVPGPGERARMLD